MELLKTQDTSAYETADKVLHFLETIHPDQDVPHDKSPVASLCFEAIQLFRRIIKSLSDLDQLALAKMRYQSLERSSHRLWLWSDAYDVSQGGIDHLFTDSHSIRRPVSDLLLAISAALTDRLLPCLSTQLELESDSINTLQSLRSSLKGLVENMETDGSDSGSLGTHSDDDSDDIDEIAEDLRADTMGLMELDSLIRNPVFDVEAERSVNGVDLQTWLPHKVYCEKVENRFPRQPMGACDGDLALHLVGAGNEGSLFHDSALGSSLPTDSSYAETVMSYRDEVGQSTRIPPLSRAAKEGEPFKCLACGKSVSFKMNSGWKQHLLADLCPWLCLEASCTSADQTFASRVDWVSHLALEHGMEPEWKSFQCPLCHTDTGAGKVAVLWHLGGHLEEISLGALPMAHDSDDDSQLDTNSDTSDDNPHVANGPPHSKDDLSDQTPLLENERTQATLGYIDQLAKFHKQQATDLTRLPYIQKKPVDLYRLKETVEAHGGFDNVCRTRKWDEIARELGYSSKTTRSLSTSLKNTFDRWLNPYENYLRQQRPGANQQLENKHDRPGQGDTMENEPENEPSKDHRTADGEKVPDPIIVVLAERASEDRLLRDLMRRVAVDDAQAHELAHFKGIIDEIAADIQGQNTARPYPTESKSLGGVLKAPTIEPTSRTPCKQVDHEIRQLREENRPKGIQTRAATKAAERARRESWQYQSQFTQPHSSSSVDIDAPSAVRNKFQPSGTPHTTPSSDPERATDASEPVEQLPSYTCPDCGYHPQGKEENFAVYYRKHRKTHQDRLAALR
ncbi:hypothetical protein PG997_011368 [Apiospora hydei]|uniref:ARID domain-containing protein n=1 Tax=Apiospora hydei TaxID=1337664 RepID=A0ABR1VLR9_9PEZI